MSAIKQGERRWLYADGNDRRGNLFSRVSQDASFRACNAGNPTVLCAKKDGQYHLAYVLDASNYDNFNEAPGAQPNDIHWEVVDMIIRAAFYHRELQSPNSPQVQNLIRMIYSKWHNLKPEERSFYQHFLTLKRGNVVLSENDYPSTVNPGNYVFQLNGSAFEESLPYAPGYTRLWFTSTAGNHEVRPILNSEILRRTYRELFATGALAGEIGVPTSYATTVTTSNGLFSISDSAEKFVRKQLYSMTKTRFIDEPEVDETTSFGDFTAIIGNSKYFRDVNGEYYIIENNKPVKLDRDSDVAKQLLSIGNNCFGTGASKASCNTVLNKCLLDNDPSSVKDCIEALSHTPNIVDEMKNQIQKLHPLVALRILQRFGFKRHNVFDSASNQNIFKVETVAHWRKRFLANNDRLTNEDKQNLESGNHVLLQYLELLSQYINCNPGVLNKGYSGTTVEQQGLPGLRSERAVKLGVELRKEPPSGANAKYNLALFNQFINNGYQGTLHRAGVNPIFAGIAQGGIINSPLHSIIGTTPGMVGVVQAGGGSDFEHIIKNLNRGCSSAKLINAIFGSQTELMRGRRQQLNQEDYNRIISRIEQLTKLESELLQTTAFISEYNNLFNIYGEYAGETLTEKKIQDLVNRHHRLQTNKFSTEKDLSNILVKLEKLTGDDNSGYKNITLN